MSDCGVCVYSYDAEPSEFFSSRIILKSRKSHACSECGKILGAGNSYHIATGYQEDEFWTYKTCLICEEIRAAFSCDGITYGGVFWESMEDCYDSLNVSCFEKLATPEAKSELRRRWMEWKGLAHP